MAPDATQERYETRVDSGGHLHGEARHARGSAHFSVIGRSVPRENADARALPIGSAPVRRSNHQGEGRVMRLSATGWFASVSRLTDCDACAHPSAPGRDRGGQLVQRLEVHGELHHRRSDRGVDERAERRAAVAAPGSLQELHDRGRPVHGSADGTRRRDHSRCHGRAGAGRAHQPGLPHARACLRLSRL